MRSFFYYWIALIALITGCHIYLHLTNIHPLWKTLDWPRMHLPYLLNNSDSLPVLKEGFLPSKISASLIISSQPSSQIRSATETTISELNSTPPLTKAIVIAKLEVEDTSWVEEHLPDWQRAIYVVDNTSAPLHVSRNKGREANVYLTYIIENYGVLPSVIAFLHPYRNGYPQAWHNDAPNYDNVYVIEHLRLESIQINGYANLRCNPNPGCPNEIQPFRDPPDYTRDAELVYRDA